MSLQQKRRDANYAALFETNHHNADNFEIKELNIATNIDTNHLNASNFDATTITVSNGVRIDPLEPKQPAHFGTLLKASHLLIVFRTKNKSLCLLNTLVRKNCLKVCNCGRF